MGLIQSAKIFISSTGQAELKPLRDMLRQKLMDAGHLPLTFEHNFPMWTEDKLGDCLNQVIGSDVLILFISDKCGSYTPVDDNMTVTYAEYYKAHRNNKLIIPFVEKHIFEFFLENVEPYLREEINAFVKEKERHPESTYAILKNLLFQLESQNKILFRKIKDTGVDEFNWAFIYDVFNNEPWTYQIELANSDKACNFVLSSLSNVFKNVLKYYSRDEDINDILSRFNRMVVFQDSASKFVSCINGGRVDTIRLLETLMGYMNGVEIPHSFSPLNDDIVDELNDCEAICLYKREDDFLQLVSCAGDSNPCEKYHVEDEDSYVAETFRRQDDDSENIFYHEGKNKLYLTKKVDDLVISLHYKFKGEWTERKVQSYENQILTAIMKQRDQFDFAIGILGGMLNG
ncbi:DUF4062 domain-containing protein [Bacillus spizizenii]|nr:DUF4062 domain-containing protein [Bacillus spizizenii]